MSTSPASNMAIAAREGVKSAAKSPSPFRAALRGGIAGMIYGTIGGRSHAETSRRHVKDVQG